MLAYHTGAAESRTTNFRTSWVGEDGLLTLHKYTAPGWETAARITNLPGHLVGDRYNRMRRLLENPVHLRLHHVQGPLRHQTGALGLLARVLQTLHEEGFLVGDLHVGD